MLWNSNFTWSKFLLLELPQSLVSESTLVCESLSQFIIWEIAFELDWTKLLLVFNPLKVDEAISKYERRAVHVVPGDCVEDLRLIFNLDNFLVSI